MRYLNMAMRTGNISKENFQKLIIPLRESHYSLEEKIEKIKIDKTKEKELLKLKMDMNQHAQQSLIRAYNTKELKHSIFQKTLEDLQDEFINIKKQDDVLKIDNRIEIIENDKIRQKQFEEIGKELKKMVLAFIDDKSLEEKYPREIEKMRKYIESMRIFKDNLPQIQHDNSDF